MLKGMKILIVDDEPLIRACLKDELEDAGAQISECENGQEAYDAVVEGSFDVVLSDIRMPVMSGVEFLKKFSASGKPLPLVILMTGFADINEEQVLALGASALLQKPAHMTKVIETIINLMNSRSR